MYSTVTGLPRGYSNKLSIHHVNRMSTAVNSFESIPQNLRAFDFQRNKRPCMEPHTSVSVFIEQIPFCLIKVLHRRL